MSSLATRHQLPATRHSAKRPARLSTLVPRLLAFVFLLAFASQGWGQSFLGLDGGLEGTATVDSTFSATAPTSVNGKWTTAGSSATQSAIALETGTVRSGAKSLKISGTSTSLARVWTPFFTLSSTTSKFFVQYYRYSTSTTNAQTQQAAILRGGTEQGTSPYATVTSASTWQKVTYAPTTVTAATSVVGVIQNKALNASAVSMFVDDFVIYADTAADNTAPNAPTAPAATNSGAGSGNLTVSWTAPGTGVDNGGYMVVRGTADPTTAPNVNGIYAVGNTVAASQTVAYVGTNVSFTDTGLTNGTTYYYRIYTFDKAYNYSAAAGAAAVSAAPVAPPTISTSGTLAAVNTTYGTASASPTSFTVSGSNMSAGITVTPPAGFEVSQTAGGASGYAGSGTAITVGSSGTISSTTVYVRLAATASAGSSPYSGNIALSSPGATSVNVATVSSTVTKAALTITAGNQTVSYGTAVSTVTGAGNYTATGFVNSETSSVIGGTASYTTTYTTTTSAGSNVATITPVTGSLTATNYSFSPANGNISVTAIAPTIGTPSVSSVNTTSATLGATVTGNGGAVLSARGTAWDTSASPTGNALAEGNTTVSAFTHSRTGLTANTLYYYRGYATNSNSTVYTADGNFTTLPLLPTVGTGSAATTSGFTANWTHPTMGSASYTYTVEVDNDSNFGSIDATVSSISSGSTTQAITGLSSSTTYYYRVKSVNTTGSSDWSTPSAGIATSAASGTITTSGTLSAFSATYPDASAEQSFTVSGSGLTGSLTVTPPAGFEVSLTSGSGFGSTATISANGTLASTTVYVRLAASSNAASYSGNVTISGGSATTQNVAIPSSTVSKATPTVSAAPTASAITYGQTLASSTITPGTSSVPGTYAFTTPATGPSVGTASQPVTFTPTDSTNYNTASTSADVTVNKATPMVSVAPTASGITYGQTLASSTLSGGTSSVAGTYAFTTPATSPAVGTASQPVTFTPTDTANYNTASTTANVTVSKATPTISVAPTASDITYGQTLANSTLSGGTASVAGAFAFTTLGTTPAVGTASQNVTFTPTDSGNYTTASTNASVTVNKATPTLSFNSSNSTTINGTVTLNATSASTGNVTYTSSNNAVVSISINGTVATGAGAGTAIITASQAADGNYNAATANQTMTVTAAPVTLASWEVNGLTAYGSSPLSANSTALGVSVIGLTRGSGVSTSSSGSAAGNAWGGDTWSTGNLTSAASANSSVYLRITPNSGYSVSFKEIAAYNFRRSGTGPASSTWQYNVGGGSYTDIVTVSLGSNSAGNSLSAIDLSGIAALQSIGANTTVEFRVVNYAASSTGTWYVYNITGDDLNIKGTITQLAPTVTASTINGTVGTALSANITVSNSPTGYAISSGTLPAGLSLNGTTGQISGTPTTAGNGTIVAVTATNGGGTSASANLTFNIAAVAPTIGSPTVSSITTTSATLGATVTANGGETLSARGTTWGTSASPTGNSLAEGNTTVSAFTHSRTGLTANTLYYYRGYATNSNSTAYTADGNFTTLPLPPTVDTGSAVSASGFTANWSHPTMGDASYTYTLDLSTDNTFATGVTTVTGISSTSTNRVLTALNASTTYYYRVKAVNAQGSSDWSATSAGVSTSAALGAISTSGTLSAFTATYPAASAEQSFSVSGSNLSGSLLVTAPAGFEISLTSGSGFGATATISASGTLASTTVYVRLAASSNAASYSDNVAVSGGDAATQTVAVSGTVSQASQTITFGALATKNATDAAFALTGTVDSGLSITYTSSNTSVATVAGNTVTLVGAGSTTITASQAGNTNYAAATSVTQTLTVNKVAQTISGVASTANKTYGDAAYSLGATVGSGLTITYASSNTSVATIAANGTVTIVAPGTTTFTASQTGDARYSAATDATQALSVSKATPALIFNSSNSTTVNGTVTLNATSASTGAVTYTSSNNAVVSINGTVATGTGAGAAIITASQAADSNYNAATANQTMTVSVAPVVILSEDFVTNTGGDNTTTSGSGTAWTTTANFTTGTSAYTAGGAVKLGTSSATGLITSKTIDLSQGGGNFTVAFKVKGWTTVEGNITVSVTGLTSQTVAYTATISAASFESKTLNFTGGTANSTITFATTAKRAFLDDISVSYIPQAPAVSAATINGTVGTALSANITATNSPTSYAISSGMLPTGLSLNGTTGRISGTPTAAGNGTVVAVTATSAGGTSAAANLTFNIAQGSQTITFGALSAKTYGDSTFSLTATASSNLSVSYTSSNTSVATVAGSTVTVVGVGSTTITASQAGDSNYTAGTNVTQTLTVSTKSLTGTFTANDKTYDGTTSATVATRAVTGTVGADVVNHIGGTASFANATTGNGKTVTLAGATLTGAAALNYSLGSVSTTTANITQATPMISVTPTASNITIGQTLANSTLSGGTASVAGAFAFTTPATAPALGISSQGVTFTPTDSTNYTAQTTSANVGVLCLAPVLTRATLPVAGGFTVNWNAATGAGNYTVLHSASKNMTGATSVNTASTSLAITGLSNGLRYVQVRANNAAGASANSTQQVNQLQSIAAGATSYLSAPGEVGTNTVAGIFGSANEAGLASGATDSASTTILLLNSNGATANTIFYNSSVNQWREGATAMDSTAIAQGKAFMLKNNTGSTDYFLLVGSPREGGSQPTVSLNPAGKFTLCTTGRTAPTSLADMNLNPGSGAGAFKTAAKAKDADKVIVVDQTTGAATNYYHNGTTWMDGLRAVPTAEIPAGQGFFIKKASDSTFNTWTLPAE